MRISLIAALDRHNLIGRDNGLPWYLPADLRRFKQLTLGKPIVMGRRTYESIGRVLPGRDNIIISRENGYRVEGARVVHGLDEALEAASGAEEVMVIGGANIYFQFLPRADRMYLTLVHGSFEGDAWFPAYNRRDWRLIVEENHPADKENPWPHSFLTYQRLWSSRGTS
ncbi:MAG: type 3 dihydrofolate reductase [Halothiobacillaceae bacterium]|nr:type 3 dihydrofolate reductase [Halothiobacillaceae bacterium]